MTRRQIASMIDHTVLNPASPGSAFRDCCRFAAENGCASVCVCPFAVADCAKALRGTGVAVCTVVGFPHGTAATAAKVAEARIAIADGATEIDMVVNPSKVVDGDWEYVERDISEVVRAVHAEGAVLKVIFECCLLDDAQKARLCGICTAAGADFVKTSTGYGKGGATVADVRLMAANVGPGVKIKAAGGIHSADEVRALLAAGATRFGCSRTADILSGFPE
ncbi:MAG: deoxyribose-phosphate aldolase [Kiritimatiellae bacterium]|nr:deoxyribose-phosphate aldolase [Kiritimatiellia bacterium]